MAGEYSATKSACRSNAVILVRAAPGSAEGLAALDEARRRIGESAVLTVFLHGPGVGWARSNQAKAWAELRGRDDVLLLVCQAAWRRRYGERQPQVFSISSLVQFWHRAVQADELVGYCSSP